MAVRVKCNSKYQRVIVRERIREIATTTTYYVVFSFFLHAQ